MKSTVQSKQGQVMRYSKPVHLERTSNLCLTILNYQMDSGK